MYAWFANCKVLEASSTVRIWKFSRRSLEGVTVLYSELVDQQNKADANKKDTYWGPYIPSFTGMDTTFIAPLIIWYI